MPKKPPTRRIAHWQTLALLLALFSANFGIAASYPVRAYTNDEQLVLEFQDAMQTWDGPELAKVITLRPSIPMLCSWNSDTEIACRFEQRKLQQASQYRIEIAAGLLTQAAVALPHLQLDFKTERPFLSIDAAPYGTDAGVPGLVVTSNLEVSIEAIAAVLEYRVDGVLQALPRMQRLPPRWTGAQEIRFAVNKLELANTQQTIEWHVKPGLQSSTGALLGEQKERLLYALTHERFRLRSAQCTTHGKSVGTNSDTKTITVSCEPGEDVTLTFSRKLSAAAKLTFADQLPNSVRLENWQEQYSWGSDGSDAPQLGPGSSVQLIMSRARKRHEIKLQRRMDLENDAFEPMLLALQSTDFRPQWRAPHTQAIIADGRRIPLLLESINASASAFFIESSGSENGPDTLIQRKQIQIPSIEKINNREQAWLDESVRKNLRAGGWARFFALQSSTADELSSDYLNYTEGLQFAAPQFDLYAVGTQREVLVWAHQWQRGKPIVGSDVALIYLANAKDPGQVIARAQTNASGVARLALDPQFVAPKPTNTQRYPLLLLHAQKGRLSAVLPSTAFGYYDKQFGAPAERALWGITDRPLYRAGELLHYRFWQREIAAARAVRLNAATTAAITLVLYKADQGAEIRSWQTAPDALGNMQGEFALPQHMQDGKYCIGIAALRRDNICFYVGSYQPQDLWAIASAPKRLVYAPILPATLDTPQYVNAQRISFALESGYYSGGAASQVAITDVEAYLYPASIVAAYPQHSDYHFGNAAEWEIEAVELRAAPSNPAKTDQNGKAELVLELPGLKAKTKLPAFGQLLFSAGVTPQGRAGAVSNPVTQRFASYPRFLGLSIEPRWPDASQAVQAKAIVIHADGTQAPAAAVSISVYFSADFYANDGDGAAIKIGQCTLQTGVLSPCNFPRNLSGRYRLVASSPGAAPATLESYVWVDGDQTPSAAEALTADLTLIQAPSPTNLNLRVRLTQPFKQANVLFLFARGDAVLGHSVQQINQAFSEHTLALDPAWQGRVELMAYVRDADTSSITRAGFRQVTPVQEAFLEIVLPKPKAKPALQIAFDRAKATPGQRVQLTVRNRSGVPQEVAISVMDDAIRALAQEFLPYSDPQGEYFLGAIASDEARLWSASFAAWNQTPWRWTMGVQSDETSMELSAVEVTGSRIKRSDVIGQVLDSGVDSSSKQTPQVPTALRTRSNFANVALWHPNLTLAPGQQHKFEIALPDNLTRWRAIAWSSDVDDDFQMQEATLETGLPLELRLTTPARLYVGDRARLAGNIRSNSEKSESTELHWRVEGGAGAQAKRLQDKQVTKLIPAGGQVSDGLEVTAQRTGVLQVLLSAKAGHLPDLAQDSVSTNVPIESPWIAASTVQAGWLDASTIRLTLPKLPTGARDPELEVALLQGARGLSSSWTQSLKDYPHRCWEQILSRAVAAALHLRSTQADPNAWPDAQAVVREALDNAAVFQNARGDFRYFGPSLSYDARATPSVALTSYTITALRLLDELGFVVPSAVMQKADSFLVDFKPNSYTYTSPDGKADALALAQAAQLKPKLATLKSLYRGWSNLAFSARIALTRALAQAGQVEQFAAWQALLKKAPLRGKSRALISYQDAPEWMSSAVREQCALIAMATDFPALTDLSTVRELRAGLSDLYAGGINTSDTQASAVCLMALRDRPGSRDFGSQDFGANEPSAATPKLLATVTVALAAQKQILSLNTGVDQVSTRFSAAALRRDVKPGGENALSIQATQLGSAPASFIATLRYLEDARVAKASAIGFTLSRNYEVLRDGTWKNILDIGIVEGDWVRASLTLSASADRYFVALNDVVPGGLLPTDLNLNGVAGLDLKSVSNTGSSWFRERKLDALNPRFYAEFLPAGEHTVYYFLRAASAGDYLAAPAYAELMYGTASKARTPSTRIRVGE